MPIYDTSTPAARRALRAATIVLAVALSGAGAAQGTGNGNKAPAKSPAAIQQKSATKVPAGDSAQAPARPQAPVQDKKATAPDSGAEVKDAERKAAADKRREEKKKKDEEREKKQVDWIEKTLEYGIQQDRVDAMNAIIKVRDTAEKERLGRKLRESLREEIDIEVKAKAIYVLGEIRLKEAVPELVTALDDDSQDVKIAAVYAMKRIDDRSVTGKLSEELKKQDLKKDSNYTEAIIDTLGAFKAKELKDFAIGEIKKDSTSPGIRQNLVIFLGKVEATDSKDFLMKLAKDDSEDSAIRAYAVNSLARMKLTDTSPEIDRIIKEIDSYPVKKRQRYYKLYIYSIAALARMGDKNVYPRLINAIRSNNEQVRLQAVKLIKEIPEKRTIDILKYKVKNDPSVKVQRAAREALEELGVSPDDGEKKKDAPAERKEAK